MQVTLEIIMEKLEEIDSKIDNFLGFIELSEKEVEELEREFEIAKKEGITLDKFLEEIKNESNIVKSG